MCIRDRLWISGRRSRWILLVYLKKGRRKTWTQLQQGTTASIVLYRLYSRIQQCDWLAQFFLCVQLERFGRKLSDVHFFVYYSVLLFISLFCLCLISELCLTKYYERMDKKQRDSGRGWLLVWPRFAPLTPVPMIPHQVEIQFVTSPSFPVSLFGLPLFHFGIRK